MRPLIVFLVVCLLAVPALARSGTIPLLALSEQEDGSATGTLASLSLEIRPGSERVFLETVPLAKVATQISMRFAQQVACKELRVDCQEKDFIYTIVAAPGLVGGPSAGAAAAVLTASLLEGLDLRDDVALTGTINSGGLIGPVGGIKEKIEVSSAGGIKTVLVPMGSRIGDGNVTIDLQEWGKRNNVTVVEVATLDEALYYFTGVNLSQEVPPLSIDPEYTNRMRMVALALCNRTAKLAALAKPGNDNLTRDLWTNAKNFSRRSDTLMAEGSYYSAASYCFRGGIVLNTLITLQRNESEQETQDRIRKVFFGIAKLNKETDAMPLRTLTDLQTFISVKERMIEAADTLVDASETENQSVAQESVIYAEERLASAKSWSAFFGLPGPEFRIDQAALAKSCYTKLGEAEERYSYVRTFFPDALADTRLQLDRAHRDAQNKSYAICLGTASKAKAEADLILSASAYEEDQLADAFAIKMTVARKSLVEAQRLGSFPLIGYNYYQYGNDLAGDDPYSGLLYAEYALELSNLDLYFARERPWWQGLMTRSQELPNWTVIVLIIAAAAAGAAITLSSVLYARRRQHTRLATPSLPTPMKKRRKGRRD